MRFNARVAGVGHTIRRRPAVAPGQRGDVERRPGGWHARRAGHGWSQPPVPRPVPQVLSWVLPYRILPCTSTYDHGTGTDGCGAVRGGGPVQSHTWPSPPSSLVILLAKSCTHWYDASASSRSRMHRRRGATPASPDAHCLRPICNGPDRTGRVPVDWRRGSQITPFWHGFLHTDNPPGRPGGWHSPLCGGRPGGPARRGVPTRWKRYEP
jgi:hypothetical protein